MFSMEQRYCLLNEGTLTVGILLNQLANIRCIHRGPCINYRNMEASNNYR